MSRLRSRGRGGPAAVPVPAPPAAADGRAPACAPPFPPRVASEAVAGRVTRAAHRRAARRRAAVQRGVTAAAISGTALAFGAPGSHLLATAAGAPGHRAVELAAADATGPLDASPPGADLEALGTVDGTRIAASVLPVPAAPGPSDADAGSRALAKAADLHEALLRELARVNCDADLSALGAVKPWVREAARFLSCLYDRPTLIGLAQRSRDSDHPRGLAVDLMVRGERGDRIAECALRNRKALGVSYVIWEQRINYGDGWEPMEDRGGDTENHVDHVHISFERAPGSGKPVPGLCR